MTRQELRALTADILGIHACPCCLGSMTERTDTILIAADKYAATFAESRMDALIQGVKEGADDDHLRVPGLLGGPD